MKKTALTVLLVLSRFYIIAQFTDNKINLYLGYSMSNYLGKETINEDNYITPSLFSNFIDLKGLSLEGFYKIKPCMSVGSVLNYTHSANWKSNHYTDYEDSRISIFSFSPAVQFHSKYSSTGILNRMKFFIDIAPNLGIVKIELEHPVFIIQNGGIPVTEATNSNDLFFGIKGGAGINFTLTRQLGFYMNPSFQYNWITSKLYNDNHPICLKIDFGVFYRFKRNKYYLQ